MQVRCPLCHHPVEVVDDTLLDDLVCPSCETNFSLVGADATVSHHAAGPRRLGHFELTELLRWSKRQPAVASLAAAVLLSLTAGTIISASFAWNESIHRQQAVAAKQRLALANKAVSEMLVEVGAGALSNVPEMESVRATLLDKALLLYETSSAQDDTSRHETAIANFQVGQIQRTLGKAEHAEAAYQEAIAQLSALSHDFPAHAPYRQELALSHMWLAELLRDVYNTVSIVDPSVFSPPSPTRRPNQQL